MSMPGIERLDLFTTPLHLVRNPDASVLAHGLRRYVDVRRASEPSLEGSHSNMRGWHSPPDLQHADDGAVRRLCDWVFARFGDVLSDVVERDVAELPVQWGLSAWAMVFERGAYSAPHDHADAVWSAVYWLDVGEPTSAVGGRLGLLDPRTGIGRRHPIPMFAPDFVLKPEAGMLALFPSWLRHQVFPYDGDGRRVSFSFNLSARTES